MSGRSDTQRAFWGKGSWALRLATLVMLLTLAFTCKFALPQQSNSLVTIAFAEENVSGDPSEPGETAEAEDKQ